MKTSAPPIATCQEPQVICRSGMSLIRLTSGMKLSVQITRGIESLFGTRDENIRVLENGLHVTASLMNDSLEIEGDEPERHPRRQHSRGLCRADQRGPGFHERRPEQLSARGHRGSRSDAAQPGAQRPAAEFRQEDAGAEDREPAALRGSDRAPRPGFRRRARRARAKHISPSPWQYRRC